MCEALSRGLMVAVLVTAAMLGWCGYASASEGTLHGRVTNEYGSAATLVGSTVRVLDQTGLSIAATTTGLDGSYRLSVPDGLYDVQVIPAPASTLAATIVEDVSVAGDTVLDIVLLPDDQRKRFISTILNDQGTPVPGVSVWLFGDGGLSGGWQTDENGRATVSVDIGDYQLYIEGSGERLPSFELLTAPFSIDSDRTETIRLAPNKLAVHVSGKADLPIDGTSVRASFDEEQHDRFVLFDGIEVEYARTDTHGNVDTNGVAYLWTFDHHGSSGSATPVESSGYAPTAFEVPAADSDAELSVTLDEAIRFTGRLVDRDGQPFEHAWLSFHGGWPHERVEVGEDGRFAALLAAATYEVEVLVLSGETMIDLTAPNVALNASREETITLPTRELDVGVVRLGGEPVPGSNVAVRLSDVDSMELFPGAFVPRYHASVRSSGRTGSDGRARVMTLPHAGSPADDNVVSPPGGLGLAPRRFAIPAAAGDDALTVALGGVQFSGRVVDAQGAPVAEAQVELSGATSGARGNTDVDGAFSLAVEPGEYRLNVRGEIRHDTDFELSTDFEFSTNSIQVVADRTQDITVPTRALRIVALGTDDFPLANAEVWVRSQDLVPVEVSPGIEILSGEFSARGTTTTGGQLTLTALPHPAGPADSLLSPRDDRYIERWFALPGATEDSDLEVRVQRGIRVRAQVEQADGVPLPGVGVAFEPLVADPTVGASFRGVTASDGTAAFYIAPGEGVLRLSRSRDPDAGGAGFTLLSAPLTIGADMTDPFVVALPTHRLDVSVRGSGEPVNDAAITVASEDLVLPDLAPGVPFVQGRFESVATTDANGTARVGVLAHRGSSRSFNHVEPPDGSRFLTTPFALPASASDSRLDIHLLPSVAATPRVSVADTTVDPEGAPGTTTDAEFTLRLEEPSADPVVARYTVSGLTARASEDFDARAGTVTFAAGALEATSKVPVFGDDRVEEDETFQLTLDADPAIEIVDGVGVATIIDDDVATNVAPVAISDSFAARPSATLTVPAPGVLANDIDIDGDVLSATPVAGPAHGTLALNEDGSFSYAPAPGFVGSDSFTYTASDGRLQAGPATVTVAVTYAFTGFFRPIDNDAVFNVVKAGSAIPVKFSLDGDHGLQILRSDSPTSQPVACDSAAPSDPIEETVTGGSTGLSYDPLVDQYRYIWTTYKAWAGSCRQLTLTLADGTPHTALFKLTKFAP